jgi:hypothetical protein
VVQNIINKKISVLSDIFLDMGILHRYIVLETLKTLKNKRAENENDSTKIEKKLEDS